MAAGSGPVIPLYDYQRRWIDDDSRFKAAVKSTQIGYSFAAALDSVFHCIDPRRHDDEIILSRSDRQSLEFAEKAKLHCKALQVADTVLDVGWFQETSIRQSTITFPNGRRLIALPANPDTARGFTGNMTLDEFGFHLDDLKIWRAAFGRASRGGLKVRVISTPNADRGKYHELAKKLGLADGVAPQTQPVREGGWSGHWCDIFMAVADGCPMDPAEIREGLDDEDGWLQEYCCIFLSDAAQYIPTDLIIAAESVEASIAIDPFWVPKGPCYFGYDVGRRRDLAVNTIVEELGDTLWMRALIELEKKKFRIQKQSIRDAAEFCLRGCIDSTGLGEQMAEEMCEEFPGRVEGVHFTAPVKQDLAVSMKQRFEDHTIRTADYKPLQRDLKAVKKITTSAGNVRFDADRTALGHADRFWSLGLANHAAGKPSGVGVPGYVSSGVLRPSAQLAGAW